MASFDRSRSRRLVPLVCAVALAGLTGGAEQARASPLFVETPAKATVKVPRYGVFERTFRSSGGGGYSNPWEQVQLTMTLTSPTGGTTSIGGFYYGGNQWKARFAPARLGHWRWTATLADGQRSQRFSGAFTVVAGGSHGFVLRSPYNRSRWVFSDGSPYYPLGIEDCVGDDDNQSSKSPFVDWGLDGRRVNAETYLSAYQRAGINLFRWSTGNCAIGLYRTIAPGGNVYLTREGAWGDQLVRCLRRHGFCVFSTIFAFHSLFAQQPSAAELEAVKRYVKYVVNRYGAYVDFWELMNEATASTAWYTAVGSYLRSVDPYNHPISTSSERPDLPVIDISSPHWYQTESEFESDKITWDLFNQWKQPGKPVIVGEQGNAGHNWDPTSALRMRLRAWTAFFAEGSLIFWNTSNTKNYRAGSGNIYLGPEERRFLRVLQSFTRGFDPRARIAPVVLSPSTSIRGYALSGPRQYAAYLHAFRDHQSATNGASLTINISRPGTATWISPATGKVLGRTVLSRSGAWTLRVPSFVTDVALKVR